MLLYFLFFVRILCRLNSFIFFISMKYLISRRLDIRIQHQSIVFIMIFFFAITKISSNLAKLQTSIGFLLSIHDHEYIFMISKISLWSEKFEISTDLLARRMRKNKKTIWRIRWLFFYYHHSYARTTLTLPSHHRWTNKTLFFDFIRSTQFEVQPSKFQSVISSIRLCPIFHIATKCEVFCSHVICMYTLYSIPKYMESWCDMMSK